MFETLLPHWPFLVAALAFGLVGQVMKGAVFTAARIRAGGPVGHLCAWGRRTLPLHPLLAGLVVGMIPGMPVSPGVGSEMAATCMYYMGAGALSVLGFDAMRAFLHDPRGKLGGG